MQCNVRPAAVLSSSGNPSLPGKAVTFSISLGAVAPVPLRARQVEEYLVGKPLTEETASPMHCGKTFAFESRGGNRITMPAPCDSYAQGRDNRQVA